MSLPNTLLSAAAVVAISLSASAQTLISSVPFTITEPGSYLVTQDLSGSKGITINASQVSLDLGGFVLQGTPGNDKDGIKIRGSRTDIAVFNGTITGWGSRGIMGDTALNSSFHDLRISNNGLCGLRAGTAAVIYNVVAQANGGGSGIMGRDATVVRDSVASSNLGWGVDVGQCSVVTAVSAFANEGGGIVASGGSRVCDNAMQENGFGLANGDDPDAEGDNNCSLVTLAGLALLGTGSYAEDNVITNNYIGLHLLGEGNVVAGNVVKGNQDNYDIAPNNLLELLLSELPEDIDWPATVVVAGTLTGIEGTTGLNINADGVTVDLNGHSLVGVPGSLCGIFVGDVVRDLAVFNGILADWGGCGVRAGFASGSRFEDILSKGNGLSGIRAGQGSVVAHCATRNNALDGILTQEDCVVESCSSTLNGNDGINVGNHSLIVDSVASENTLAGFRTGEGGTIEGSTASSNSLGIVLGLGGTARANTTSFNSILGIRPDGRNYVIENTCQSNGVGIFTIANRNRIEANTLTANDTGLQITGVSNLVLRNSASLNGSNYVIGAGNSFGALQNVAGVGSFTVTDPWANFEF